MATGNSSSVIIFDFKEKELKYLMEVNIPRADDLSFVCRWTQADLLIVDNGLWLNSIMIDLEAGFGRLLSSQRL